MPDVFSFSRVRSLEVRPKPDRGDISAEGYVFGKSVCRGDGTCIQSTGFTYFRLEGEGGCAASFLSMY